MKPTGKAVCILPDGNPDETKSGLIIPKTIKELPDRGKVVSVGPAVEQVKVGDDVKFPRKSGSSITLDDVEHLLVTEDKIQFIY